VRLTDTDEVDVRRFQALVADGRRALEHGDAGDAAESLREALGLWRDPPRSVFERACEETIRGALRAELHERTRHVLIAQGRTMTRANGPERVPARRPACLVG
jgi:hypothetical protein